MARKIKSAGKQNKNYEKRIKKIAEGTKPLNKPLPNKYLVLLIKDVIAKGHKDKKK